MASPDANSGPDGTADVAIVGAGPAGAAAAIRLARLGWQVALLDQATFPRPKVCGEALGPAAVQQLEDLGVWPACLIAGAWSFPGLVLYGPSGSRTVCRYPPGHPGVSLSRLDLDTLLVARAQAAGAVVHDHHRVTGLERQAGIWTLAGPRPLQARAVIVAAGRHQHLLPSGLRPRRSRRIVLVAPVAGIADADAEMTLILTRHGLPALLAPQGPTLATVALIADGRRPPIGPEGFLAALRALPGHGARFDRADVLAPVRGMAIRCGRTPLPVFDGGLAIGDAFGCIDPITGHGLTLALQSGHQAADLLDVALRVNRLDQTFLRLYDEAMTPLFDPPRRFADLAVHLTRHPWLTDLLLRRLAPRPDLCEGLAAIQGGLRPADLVWPLLQQVALPKIA